MYELAPSVRACLDQDVIVFLDLKLDRYASIDQNSAPAIVGVVEAGEGKAAPSLLKRGLIVTCNGGAAPTGPPKSELVGELPGDAYRSARPTGRDWAIFLYSCVVASALVRRRRLDIAFRNFAARKTASPTEHDGIGDDVARFELMRPWYPRRRVCLFDSLALMNYLVLRGRSPSLVMGVRAKPFAAHCWLQAEGICLNDSAENCRSYTAILSV